MISRVCLLLLLVTTLPVSAQISLSTGGDNGVFYGGGLGASFGNDFSYFEISPMVGKKLSTALSAGISVSYRYSKDKSIKPEFTSNDYGATIFARYKVTNTLFIEGNYEYLDYEQRTSTGSQSRKQFSSVMAGGGIQQPLGNNTSFYMSALYNFSWDKKDSPYDDPWNLRFGINVGY